VTGLAGKVAVVTGASRGVGQRVAIGLAGRGAAVALVARGQAQLGETARTISGQGGRAQVIAADVSDPRSLESLRSSVEGTLGMPSILVNAAGVFGPIQFIKDSDPAAWVEAVMVNTVGSYLMCRAFVGGMIDRGWGRIVNVTSAAALHTPGPVNSAYGTSKAALNQLTRHLAAELQGTGVTANVIHPGDVKTEMWADIRSKAERLGPAGGPFKQWADWVEATGGDDPEKAADLVLGLMDGASDGVNGRFLWIKDGLQAPIQSWAEPSDQQPWLTQSP